MARRGGELLEGFQTGMALGQQIQQSMLQRELQKRLARKDEIEQALLQVKNPGLQIATEEKVHGQDAVKALPVQPGTENDDVQAVSPGVLYNKAQAERVQNEEIARQLDKQKDLARFSSELSFNNQAALENMRYGHRDAASEKEFAQRRSLAQEAYDNAVKIGDKRAADDYRMQMDLLDKQISAGKYASPGTRTAKAPTARVSFKNEEGVETTAELPVDQVPDQYLPPSMRKNPLPEPSPFAADIDVIEGKIAEQRKQKALGDDRTGLFNLWSRDGEIKKLESQKNALSRMNVGGTQPAASRASKTLTPQIAAEYLKRAGLDQAKAQAMAKADGYE